MGDFEDKQRIQTLENELEEMTAALATAWDQLVPFLQEIPSDAASAHDLMTIAETAMVALEAPLACVFLKKTGECMTVPTDITAQDALAKKLATIPESTTVFQIRSISSWYVGRCTNWAMAPLVVNDEIIGVLGVGYDEQMPYLATDYERRLLQRMAERASSLLMAVDLEESRLREARIAQELHIASQIQRSIQPPQPPQTPVLDSEAYWRPARSVGGDAWGWVLQDNKYSGFVLDVSGKGLPAALAAVSLHTAVMLALRLSMTPDAVIETVNDQFYEAYTNAGIFATLCVFSIDFASSELMYASAGHTPSLLYYNKEWFHIEASVPPVGVLDTLDVTCDTFNLATGDMLVCYSDGFTEINTGNEFWGEEGLQDAFRKEAQLQAANASTILEGVISRANKVQVDDVPADDQTLVLTIWKGMK